MGVDKSREHSAEFLDGYLALAWDEMVEELAYDEEDGNARDSGSDESVEE